MSINAEQIQGTRLTVGVLYPLIEDLPKPKLTNLYARISERYPEEYESFTLVPDGGAVLASAHARCAIQTARLQLVYDLGSFDVAKEKAVEIMHMVAERLEISQFFGFGVKIAAKVPMKAGNKDSSEFLESALLCVSSELLDRLGSKRLGAGLRTWAGTDDVVYDLRIEPWLQDRSHVFAEVDAQFGGPAFIGLEGIADKIDRAYGYMFKDVKGFLAELKAPKK